MSTIDPIFLLSLAGGLTILFFGRRLFWLYIGLIGVLAGFELAGQLLPQQPEWLHLISGLILGAGMALLAIAFQYAAIALAGFVGAAYLVLQVGVIFPMINPAQFPSWILFIAGIFGAGLCLLIFEPALIMLSSLTGAAILVQLAPIEPLLQNLLLVILALVGGAFQFMIYKRGTKT